MNRIVIVCGFLLLTVSAKAQKVDQSELQDASVSLEKFANENSTANVFYGIGFGLTSLSFITGTETEPVNQPVLILGSVCTITGWILTRHANKHIREAAWHLESADSGVGIKLVF